ncbi:UNVERIFIED_ORG: class 3 adenylate cyclase [Rhizobium esperanzae]|uniref:hypothetical protein n=1 Tax=Rhizobium phaseoli TaxID=396 RepID=UPI0013E08176
MGRRLTTILSADVAGFSHLMGADEERTLGAFRVCRDIAEFGSAVEAVRASVQSHTS